EIARRVVAASLRCDLLTPPLPSNAASGAAEISTCIESYDHRWELSRWIEGVALPRHAEPELIAKGGEAIAHVHNAFADESTTANGDAVLLLGTCDSSVLDNARLPKPHLSHPRLPRCITDRIQRLQHLSGSIELLSKHECSVERIADRLTRQVVLGSSSDPATSMHHRKLAESLFEASVWLQRNWKTVAPELLGRLKAHAATFQRHPNCYPVSWVLRDVHRDHVLFSPPSVDSPSNVRGVLDYDAVDTDSPAADLARWAGDFCPTCADETHSSSPSHASPLDAAVAGYRNVRPFSKWELELATTLMDVNSVGGLANWTSWLIAENRHFPVSALRIRDRITHLIASVCRIC
ncbi:MAG: phosphotransferase, partial [Rhodopirellula sp. JB044]|uniref:phosphotransferase n=1 Tax=Rhodopirellula sp. JB044 TaxID=3342844 RepID=UPI00370BAC1F